ncbi:hypothetical protein ACQJBY_045078 [Aegilops geniculata]
MDDGGLFRGGSGGGALEPHCKAHGNHTHPRHRRPWLPRKPPRLQRRHRRPACPLPTLPQHPSDRRLKRPTVGAHGGERGRPHRRPDAGPRRRGGRPGQGRGGLRGVAVHAPHGPLPSALGVPLPRLPDIRGHLISTAVIRVHHSLGDGMSLITLLLASSRSAADPTRLPAMPEQPARTGAIYVPCRRQSPPAGTLAAFVMWAWSYLVLTWNTMLDAAFFAATIVFLKDPHTLFRRADGDVTSNPRRRFVHRSLSLDDVKFIKNVMNCTVNDVLIGATSAALSRYYFRKSGPSKAAKLCLRSVLPINTRPTTSLQTYVDMIESGKSNDVAWGNQLGYLLLPFHLAMHNDPLAYVCKAKKTIDRKKSSLEVIFTCKMNAFFVKMFGMKVGAFIFQRMFADTTFLFSNMVGPTEQIEFYGNPIVFIAPCSYGGPHVSHPRSYIETFNLKQYLYFCQRKASTTIHKARTLSSHIAFTKKTTLPCINY